MSISTSASRSAGPPLDVQLRPGAPATVLVRAPAGAPRRAPGEWVTANRAALRGLVAQHGAVVVRGLGLRDAAETGSVFWALADQLMYEREAFAPRQPVADGVYTSTKWPANQQMCMHHELSFTLEFPGLMLFACLTAPGDGGATAVADASAVLDALPRELTSRFDREGWLLVRTYNDEIGASWEEAFGTADRGAVETYCRGNAIDFQWQPDGGLRTWQRRPAIVRHPATGRWCWFNQIAFLNEWTLDPEVREFLVETYGADALPFTTRFGNGEPIGPDIVELLNDTYAAHTRRQPWQAGDLMLVDNISTAHSREPYTGAREVIAALADPVPLAACLPQPAQGNAR